MNAAPLIRIMGGAVRHGSRPVLHDIDFELHAGERVALTGPNGAGKSTLIHAIVGLVPFEAGTIEIFGNRCRTEADFAGIRPRTGLLFQDADDQLFCPTVLEDVAFGPLNLGRTMADARGLAEKTLEALGIGELADRVTHRLSGGEKKLVSLATVLAMEPRVLLLDEPTNGVDQEGRARLVALLDGLDQAMVIVTHEPDLVEALATRIAVLRDGRIVPGHLHEHPHVHRHGHVHVENGAATGHTHGNGDAALHTHDDHGGLDADD